MFRCISYRSVLPFDDIVSVKVDAQGRPNFCRLSDAHISYGEEEEDMLEEEHSHDAISVTEE